MTDAAVSPAQTEAKKGIDLRVGNFRLRHDGIQWTVTTIVVAKAGKTPGVERDADPSYFGRLSHALLDVLDRGVGQEDAEDLRALLRAVEAHSFAILEAAREADRQLLAMRNGDDR